MQQTARLFTDGDDQAVALPDGFRFDSDEVNIRRDPETGDVILSRKAKSLDNFCKLLEEVGPGEPEFLVERDRTPPQDRKLF